MLYRQLGKSELQVSRIAFGCMSLDPSQIESIRLLEEALDNGINFYDTADLYNKGENEKMVGKAFRSKRHQVIIATKAGNQWRKDGSGWDWNPSKEYILKAADESLRRLNTDYIDLFQLHGGTLDDPFEETKSAFESLVSAGKIRYYGISSIRPNVIRKWLDQTNVQSLMTQYSLLDRRPEEETLQWALEKQVGVLVRGGVAQGVLGGKPAHEYLGYTSEEVGSLQNTLTHISKDRTPAQTAMQYVLQNDAVTSLVAGLRTRTQLTEALQINRLDALPTETIRHLQKLLTANRYNEHRLT